jgi:tetratricopeptide (TPR) repeat protein
LRLNPKVLWALIYHGMSLWKLDRVEEAEVAFDLAESTHPRDARPPFERGKLLFNAKEYDRAAGCFERAAELNPKDKNVRLWRGAAYCNLGYYDLAIDEVEDCMSFGAATAGEYRWRGEARARLKIFSEALADFDHSIELDPTTACAHHWRGWLLIELGRWDEAERAYDEAIRLDPNVAYYYEQRSKIRAKLGREPNGKESALSVTVETRAAVPEKPIVERPADYAARCRAAWEVHDREGRHEAALGSIERAIERAPEVGEYHGCRGLTLCGLGRWDEALKAADKAVEMGNATAAAFKVRGMSLWKLDRAEEAETAFDLAESTHPRDAMPPFERGKLLFDAKEYDRAAGCFERAAELNPRDKNVRLWRGAAYCNLGYYDLAIDEVEDCMSFGATTAIEYRSRGAARAQLKLYSEALSDYDRSIELDPTTATAHAWRGWILMEVGRWDEAERAYDEAIRLAPGVADYYEQRSQIRDKLGREQQASADFETCLDLELKDNLPSMDTSQNTTPNTPLCPPPIDICSLVQSHFGGVPIEQLSLVERFFPGRVSPDVQRALDSLAQTEFTVDHFFCPKQSNSWVYNFLALYVRDRRNPIAASAALHYEVDIGEDKPVRCLWTGAWLLSYRATRFAVLTTNDQSFRRFQVAAPTTAAGEAATSAFLAYLETAIGRGESYRGKVLSLEEDDDSRGTVSGIKVHRLQRVERHDVVLPSATLELLDRNVLEFIQARPGLRELGLATKKGLLFYGPPGTGKTHTIHYLCGALPGTTTILITAEQVGRLGEYVTIARMFQPSLVVIEDVDLIARDRRTLRSGFEESLLNRLLNEMDGLQPDADILFVLTTNAPETLEDALANRPGRVDQSIEFPYPDADGRARLVRMYAGKAAIADDIVARIAARKEPMSPAFIKELMRRAAQTAVLRGDAALTLEDVNYALDELLHIGGLNGKLFGFAVSGRRGGTL